MSLNGASAHKITKDTKSVTSFAFRDLFSSEIFHYTSYK